MAHEESIAPVFDWAYIKADPDSQGLSELSCYRVTMVQATESREGLNLASNRKTGHNRPTRWRVLGEPEMRPIRVVVAHILNHQPLQMSLIEDDHVVEQVSSAAPYPTLSDAVLPRAAKRGSRWPTAHVSDERYYVVAKL